MTPCCSTGRDCRWAQWRLIVTALAVVLLSDNRSPAERMSPAAPKPISAESPKLVLAHYMPWYVASPEWGLHWAGPQQQHAPGKLDDAGLPDIWSHYHPLIGTYESADRDVIECHLLQMKLAGIDGVILDWYGISDAADYPSIDRASKKVVQVAERLGMKLAICFEDRTIQRLVETGKLRRSEIQDHLIETLQWLQDNWFGAPNYVRNDGRPLLLNFGPLYVRDPGIWKAALDSLPVRPQFFALDYLWKDAGADSGFAWIYPHIWQGEPTETEVHTALTKQFAAISSEPTQVIVSACPGFNDVYANSYPQIDHRDGATLKESLEAALRGPWPIVQLVTWNDYGEGTMIEPTHEFGYRFLEIVQQARREEATSASNFDAKDLQLPARLYKLRKSDSVSQTKLDRIGESISLGFLDEARAALDRLTISAIPAVKRVVRTDLR